MWLGGAFIAFTILFLWLDGGVRLFDIIFYPLCRLDISHNESAFICILLTHGLGTGRGSMYFLCMRVLCA